MPDAKNAALPPAPRRLYRQDSTRAPSEEQPDQDLIIRLLECVNPLPGLEEMIHRLLTGIAAATGDTGIRLYYWVEGRLRSADSTGRHESLARMDDPLAARVAESRRFGEEVHTSNTQTPDQPTAAPSWAFPLLVGDELIGVIKLESSPLHTAVLRTTLPVFFDHVARILSNEVRNHSRRQAEKTLAKSEASTRRLMKQVPIALAHLDSRGKVLSVNDRFVQVFGYTHDDVPTLAEWWPRAFPDPTYRSKVMAMWAAAVEKSARDGIDIPPYKYRIICKNGEERLIEVSGVTLGDELVATLIDITERKRAEEIRERLNRELHAISSCNQALMRASDEQALLEEICRIVCEQAGYRMAWVGYTEHDHNLSVRPRAWAGAENGYLSQTGLTWADTAAGHRPLGIAIRTGKTNYVQDFNEETESPPWIEHATERGYRAAIALPLKDDKAAVFGVLCLYSDQSQAFTSDEVNLLEELASDLAFGVISLRLRATQRYAQQQLAASEQLFRALVENSPDFIARYDREFRRVYVNPTIQKLFAAPLDNVIGNTPHVNSPLEDPDRYMARIRQVIETATECIDEMRFRNLDGEMHWASMRFTPELGVDGKVASVLAISHDITERVKAEEERKAYLHFLESLDRIDRALQKGNDIEQVMNDALDVVLDIFGCDRACLLYPCDPDAATWSVSMERVRPEYPGPRDLGDSLPTEAWVASMMRTLLDSTHPVQMGAGKDFPVPEYMAKRFSVRSFMAMALHPRIDRPWEFGIHQCFHDRIWTTQEVRLFEEIGHRLSDALNNLLITRNLSESEERFRLVFENSPLPFWEEDFSMVKRRLDELIPGPGCNVEGFLSDHPEIVRQCAKLVRVQAVNQAAVEMHEADSKEELLQGMAWTFTDESYSAFLKELVAITQGKTELRVDSVVRTMNGRRRDVTVYFSVCPGYENSLARVFVSVIDITDRKQAEVQLLASEQLFRALVENAPDYIARYDCQFRRLYVNPALQKLFNVPTERIVGTTPATFTPIRNPDQYLACLKQARDTASEVSTELSLPDTSGIERWVSMRIVPEFDAQGTVASIMTMARDITERKRAEDDLRLAASVFATSQEGILISDDANRIIDVNPAFTRLTGYSREEVLGKNPRFLSAGRQGREFYADMWYAINTKGTWQGELWNRRKNGQVYVELLSIIAVKDESGRLQHYVGAFSDISVVKAHEADLDRIAHYDTLTSVPNRRLLSDRLEQALARARRLGMNLAVCYLDLDSFKPINDQFGHETGDRLLVEVAHRLQSLSRADDTVARIGGDEFVLLWNDVRAEAECIRAIERVLSAVSAPMMLGDVPISVSASIGVTLYPEDNVDADSLLRHADHAMYSAKQLGKNRYQMFDARLERQMSARTELMAKVARALDAGQFELHFQPKIDYLAGTVDGVEALVRWLDPVLGIVGPKEFLPLIENDNLAFRMGRWVMEEAIQQAKRWDDRDIALTISVNIFPRHLKYPTFVEDVRNAIARHWPQMPQGRLLLEIVETSELDELDPIEEVIKKCLAMGIGFSLDDFGTGYSSLVYLRRLSVEELKIDQSFVRDMLEDPDDHAIVTSVISLGRAFGLRVVAEGVESAQQAQHLADLGCSVVQGYGLGRPMPANVFEKWYADFLHRGVNTCR